jgi:N-acetylglucosaminyldiphosphoundecaprenol N-acetyl-beta-D-mannosaminyltransferase
VYDDFPFRKSSDWSPVELIQTLADEGEQMSYTNAILHAGKPMVAEVAPVAGPIWVLGLPLVPLTTRQAVQAVDGLVQRRKPSYFITANLNYAMLTDRHEDLREINRQAAFILADGMPLVWSARWRGTPLPGRVAGSDLILELCQLAAERGYRVYLLGAQSSVTEKAGANLVARYPGLQIVGTASPQLGDLSEAENAAVVSEVRRARPDLLFVALGQPKGERWIYAYHRHLEVPAILQVGASLDFVAGRIRRAPTWLRQHGGEWLFRLLLEPRRLARRYLENGTFFVRILLSSEWQGHSRQSGH